jgi:hypothetical protein
LKDSHLPPDFLSRFRDPAIEKRLPAIVQRTEEHRPRRFVEYDEIQFLEFEVSVFREVHLHDCDVEARQLGEFFRRASMRDLKLHMELSASSRTDDVGYDLPGSLFEFDAVEMNRLALDDGQGAKFVADLGSATLISRLRSMTALASL